MSRLERGQRRLTGDVSKRISDYYGIPEEVLTLAEGRLPEDIQAILLRHPEELNRLRRDHAEDFIR